MIFNVKSRTSHITAFWPENHLKILLVHVQEIVLDAIIFTNSSNFLQTKIIFFL